MLDTPPIITFASRSHLRDWLALNHATSGSIWLASFKKSHRDYVPYPELVAELLCWGWIDSLPKAIDATRSALLIAPRNPKSAWSAINKAHVIRNRAAGLMAPSGEAAVANAQANGMWDFLNDVDALIDPPDLLNALGEHLPVWQALPNSVRRGTLEWIKTAKTTKTRADRIAEVVDSTRQGLRPRLFRRQAASIRT